MNWRVALAILAAMTFAVRAGAQTNGTRPSGTTGGGGGSGSSNSIGNQGGVSMSGTSGLNDALTGSTALGGFNTGASRGNTISPSNPFQQFYANPYSAGLPGGPQVSFGTAVYANVTTGSAGTGSAANRGTGSTGFGTNSGFGSTSRNTSGSSLGNNTFGSGSSLNRSTSNAGAGRAGTQSGSTFGSTGFGTNTNAGGMLGGTGNTLGGANAANRGLNTGVAGSNAGNFAPAGGSGLKSGILYATTPAFTITRPGPAQVSTQLQNVLARSTGFRGPANVAVNHVNDVIVLRGVVATEDDRILAENLVRLSPGVREVVNELKVNGPAAPAPTPAGS